MATAEPVNVELQDHEEHAQQEKSRASCSSEHRTDSNAQSSMEKKASAAISQAVTNEAAASADPLANAGPNGIVYQNMGWWQAGILMIAETISLGILSLPSTLGTLGLVPGLILLLGLGALATYTGLVIGRFKLRFPAVHNMADAGAMIFRGTKAGKAIERVLWFGVQAFVGFIMGAHLVSWGITLNVLTDRKACTITYLVSGTILSLLATMPRQLSKISWLAYVSFVSIFVAVIVTIVGVGIADEAHAGSSSAASVYDFAGEALHGSGAVSMRFWPKPDLPFHKYFQAASQIVFAYAGHVAFFQIISEQKKPKDFPKALALLQCCDITLYVVVSIVVYYFAGDAVASPAINSVHGLLQKVIWGLATPTIIIAGVINASVTVKMIFMRLTSASTFFRSYPLPNNDSWLHSRSWQAWSLWAAVNAALWVVAWLIAESIPVFNNLLGLTSAIFASWFTYGLAGMMGLYMSMDEAKTWSECRRAWGKGWKRRCFTAANVFCVFVSSVIFVVGIYASIRSMIEDGEKQKPWSCQAKV